VRRSACLAATRTSATNPSASRSSHQTCCECEGCVHAAAAVFVLIGGVLWVYSWGKHMGFLRCPWRWGREGACCVNLVVPIPSCTCLQGVLMIIIMTVNPPPRGLPHSAIKLTCTSLHHTSPLACGTCPSVCFLSCDFVLCAVLSHPCPAAR
jgi:hypothetical protein